MGVVEEFVAKYGRYAFENEKRTGVPALVTLAQAALESGWGKSAVGNMFFGIKADKSWTGAKQLLWTTEYINGAYQKIQDWFRAYASPLESFADHAAFLRRNSRYAPAFRTTDPYAFAKAVAQAGYATDPGYYEKVANLMRQMATPYEEVKKKLQPQLPT